MSHQFSFYLTTVDLQLSLQVAAKCGDFVILHSRSPEARPHIVGTIDFNENGNPWLYFYLTRQEYLHLIKMREVPAQKYWSIDALRSPVIELNRSFWDDKIIREGRFYFQDSYCGETAEKVYKSASFTRWAKCVLTAAKKTMKRMPALNAYVGPDALSLVKERGVKLMNGTGGVMLEQV